MGYEIKVGDQQSEINYLVMKVMLWKFLLTIEIIRLILLRFEKRGFYSIIYDGISYNVELLKKGNNNYHATTLYNSFDIEVIDAETRYKNSRKNQKMKIMHLSQPQCPERL